ncbi:hypothetical protein IC582_028510 [Cucumis melo]|uniref:Uncharacterized protein n=1 Tax=Cucumis melo TaxID=3656 RepID=A0A9I9ELM4_CUCME
MSLSLSPSLIPKSLYLHQSAHYSPRKVSTARNHSHTNSTTRDHSHYSSLLSPFSDSDPRHLQTHSLPMVTHNLPTATHGLLTATLDLQTTTHCNLMMTHCSPTPPMQT